MRRLRLALLAAALAAVGCASAAPMQARSVLSSPGPLPVTGEFQVATPRQLLLVSASAWAEIEDVPIEVQVLVDGSVVGRCRIFSNAPATHRALVCPAVPLSLSPGRHVVELRRGNDETVDDQEDLFEVTLFER